MNRSQALNPMTGGTAGYVQGVIRRGRRRDLVDIVFSIVGLALLTVLLLLFVGGNALYFGGGLLACAGLWLGSDAFDQARFWRHYGR